MPLELSVVIPVKDDAPALAACLDLISRQTRPPLEVVVLDNASVDDSAQVAVAHGARVVVESRPGIPAAASTGYDAAVGQVIVRRDADSRPPADWLERIAAAFAEDDDLDALTGSGDFYDVPRWRALLHNHLYLWAYDVSMHTAIARHPLWGSDVAVRQRAWAVAPPCRAPRGPRAARRRRPHLRPRPGGPDPARPEPAGGCIRPIAARGGGRAGVGSSARSAP